MKSFLKGFYFFFKCLIGVGSIHDDHDGGLGSICLWSEVFYDIHDYPVEKGGDGHPSHFHTYTCPNCGKEFQI